MRRHYLRSAVIAIALLVGALALVLGVALSAGPGKAGAADPPSPFANVDNVIVFIGDGMGPNHVEVGRRLDALAGDTFTIDAIDWDGEGTLDTSSIDGITDSAAAATALATGQETWNDWVSRGPNASNMVVDFETALEVAERAQKATGLITDLELSDATPAAFAAHADSRDYADEITMEMAAQDIEFLASGGWSESSILFDLGYPQPDVTVTSLSQLSPYLAGTTAWPDKMYGIFGKTTLAYNIDREEEGVVKKQPTLPQLTHAAIDVLSKDEDGFFVMIEGGSNDWGGHSRDAAWVGAEIRELDQAVEWAYDWAKARTDTLIIVEADHETGGLVVNGDPKYALIAKQKASTEWMWGLIKRNPTAATVKSVLAKYTAISSQLTSADVTKILTNKEMGISDVLAKYYHVGWGWSGTDEGDHTATQVPVMAWGPGASAFDVSTWTTPDNEGSGDLLLDAVSH